LFYFRISGESKIGLIVPGVVKANTLSVDLLFDEQGWSIGWHKHAESWEWFEVEVGISHGDMFNGKCWFSVGSSVE